MAQNCIKRKLSYSSLSEQQNFVQSGQASKDCLKKHRKETKINNLKKAF